MIDLEEFIDYEFLKNDDKTLTVPVSILTGAFKDVIVRFNTVKIIEEADDYARVHFDYQIISSKIPKNELENNSDFKNYLGELLRNIVVNAGSMDEDREDNFEELDTQRRILAENSSVPEE